jgi:hypothetical protein
VDEKCTSGVFVPTETRGGHRGDALLAVVGMGLAALGVGPPKARRTYPGVHR